MDLGEAGGLDDPGRIPVAHPGDVLGDGAREQGDVLRQVAEMRPYLLAAPVGEVGVVEAHRALGRPQHPEHQAAQRALAGAGGADDPDGHSGATVNETFCRTGRA